MAAESMDGLRELVQGIFVDPAKLKGLLEALANEAMKQEVSAHVGAAMHERSDTRVGHRNGYKPRGLKTRAGELELEVPQVRDCEPYHPSLFGKFERSERALLVACSEMYCQGVSTRNVREVLESMGAGELSAMTVSRIAAELDEKLKVFRARDLKQTTWPYLQIDARYEKVRVSGRVISQAVLVTVGFDAQGMRHVLDWRVNDSESEQTWGDLLRDLKDRGMSGVKLITSDAHGGIRSAITRHLQGTSWQRCQVHYKRQLAAKAPYKLRKQLMNDLRSVLMPAEKSECMSRAVEMAIKWEGRYPAIGRMLRESLEDCLSVLSFPQEHRRHLSSTNLLESLMKRLKKRTAVVGVFPNRASCDRLIGALLVEVDESWQSENIRQLNMNLKE